MKGIAFAFCLLLTLAHAQYFTLNSFNGDFNSLISASNAVSYSDIVTVANYYGCKTWVKNQCTECSNGYHFNDKGVCCEIPSLCSQFNTAQGLCVACYQGYVIANGTCCLDTLDVGCSKWNGNICLTCSKGWYKNAQGACVRVSDQCYTWDDNTGQCLSCYNGYILSAGSCLINPNPQTGAKDPLCGTWIGATCGACAYRAYFNSQNVCVKVSDQCQTWDPNSGACITCYGGYSLINGICTPSAVVSPSDPGCSLWNSLTTVCLQCSQRFYFNGRQCTPVSDQCNTWSGLGACTSCYSGYDLQADGKCVLSNTNSKPSDVGCGTWDWKNQKCLKCSNDWVFNNNGVCTPVSDQCNTFDLSGKCLTCYLGYNVYQGQCVLSPDQAPTDPGCGTWDWKNQRCLQCSNKWVFNKHGVCVPVSDQCNTFDRSGKCLSCYDGYNLVGAECVLAPVQNPSDVGCGTWDWKNQRCLKCSNNWVFSNNGVCVPVSDQCNTFDLSGKCSSCYIGYNLVSGKCVLAPIQGPTDLGCATWDWKNQKCLQCSKDFVFNSNGVCSPVSSQCNTFDLSGKCLSCYSGYNLVGGQCVLAPVQGPTDPGCGLWDWNKQKCLQCSNNWVFNNNGVCTPVSSQCKTFDLSGRCLSCYNGYNLVSSACVAAPIQGPSDLGCATWDWANQKCLACSKNWVFNPNGVCIQVSDQCKTFTSTGSCDSCYLGYNLVGGKCVLAPIQSVSDVGCAVWDWTNQICQQCSNRWVFNSLKKCVPVNDNCQLWNSAGVCTSCYGGYVLNGGVCTQGNSLCQSSNSNGACTSCYTGYILDNGNCVPISKLANLALYYSICCPERLASLTKTVDGANSTKV